MSPKHYFKCFKQQKMYLKNCKANKFSKTTNAVHSNHLQVCQSMSLFVFAVLFKSSIHVLSGYIFCVSLSLVAVPRSTHCLNFDKFCHTAPLSSVLNLVGINVLKLFRF